jgi:uncharacterized protein YbcC (UPF0753/DUF2309 family)
MKPMEKTRQVNAVHSFDEMHVLNELKHFLPCQTPIKDFIHHNTLHAFQLEKFYDAIFRASKMFGYNVTLHIEEFRQLLKQGRIRPDILDQAIVNAKGNAALGEWKDKLLNKKYDSVFEPRIGQLRSGWNKRRGIDLDSKVHPLLFRILSAYLDQGIASWKFEGTKDGFLKAISKLEQNSMSSFFKTKRAKHFLLSGHAEMNDLLKIVVGDPHCYEQYIFDQQFAHHGWSGLVSAVEDAPHTLLAGNIISLRDVIIFELLMEIDALDSAFGENWEPLCTSHEHRTEELFAPVPKTELNEVLRIWQDAFEWTYYDEVLKGMQIAGKQKQQVVTKKTFQAVFCIDERECSLRRHIEHMDSNCETLGYPGFFSAEFYFQPEGGKFYEKLCPAPVIPKYLIKEKPVNHKRDHEIMYSPQAHSLFGGTLFTLVFGPVAAFKIFLNLFRPKMSPAISNAFSHMNPDAELTLEHDGQHENGLQIGFTVEEMTNRVETLLRGTGMVGDYAPIIYILAHGSSSANNPHHSAHDCGACSGRPGSVNARVFAAMANHPKVREMLVQRGITLPASTVFVGGMHDTAADQIQYYDVKKLSAEHLEMHQQNVVSFENALDLNTKERSRRFSSINTLGSVKSTRKEIFDRSASLFEPRPELGHGTNTLCIVGRRQMTKGLFLDRRAFLNSYDCTTDPEGKLLIGVMRPLGIVCGGINLEYYFSRIDNYRLGAGTKLPHNVTSLVGVTNSSDGDLRPGLPVQMVEVHDPVRLLLIVEHHPEVVLKTIQSEPPLYEWFENEWVHIMALDPDTGEFHYFRNGEFHLYKPLAKDIPKLGDPEKFFERSLANEMESAHITDATKENLPVYLLE